MARAALVLLVLAATAVAHAASLTSPGKLRVGVATLSVTDQSREGRTLPVEIWYPARTAARGAEPIEKRYPLILMAHGFCGSRLNYEYLTTHLASWGFIVAAPDFTGITKDDCDRQQVTITQDDLAPDLAFVCRVLHDLGGPLGQWAAHVRGEPTGLVGHSLGGYGIVQAPIIEKSFTTMVGLAPAIHVGDADAVAQLPQPAAWMMMGATADILVDYTTQVEPFFERLAAPAFLVRVTGGAHGGFSDSTSALTADELAVQQDAVKRWATPFFLRYLAKKKKFARHLKATDDGTVALVARPK